jgi:hypothetical protein
MNPWVFEASNESLVAINLFTTENTLLHIANETSAATEQKAAK